MKRVTRRTKRIITTLSGAVFFIMAAACAQKDDVAAIRALIQKGAALAEAHDISGMMALATDDIVAQPGTRNRLEIKRIIWSALMHYGKVRILYPKPSVDLYNEDNQASCGMYVLIVKKDRVVPDLKDLYDDPKNWLETVGENADLYQLKLELVKTDGRWRVRKAYLEAFKGMGFSD